MLLRAALALARSGGSEGAAPDEIALGAGTPPQDVWRALTAPGVGHVPAASPVGIEEPASGLSLLESIGPGKPSGRASDPVS